MTTLRLHRKLKQADADLGLMWHHGKPRHALMSHTVPQPCLSPVHNM
jgi:hypothetical protein